MPLAPGSRARHDSVMRSLEVPRLRLLSWCRSDAGPCCHRTCHSVSVRGNATAAGYTVVIAIISVGLVGTFAWSCSGHLFVV